MVTTKINNFLHNVKNCSVHQQKLKQFTQKQSKTVLTIANFIEKKGIVRICQSQNINRKKYQTKQHLFL